MRNFALTSLLALALGGCASASKHAEHAHEHVETVAEAIDANRPLLKAEAVLEARSGSQVAGTITFKERRQEAAGQTFILVDVSYDVTGLDGGEERGFHIHEVGDCSAPDASSAGGHFNPSGHKHGPADDQLSHSGDLGNIMANPSGRAEGEIKSLSKITLGPGATNIIGRSVIVHLGKDDYTTQPTGDAGGRAACGIIKLVN